MKVIIAIISIIAVIDICLKRQKIKKNEIEKDILISEIHQERQNYIKEKRTIEYFFSIINGNFPKEICKIDIEYLRNKENFFFISKEEICKFRFLLSQLEIKKLFESIGIIIYNQKIYYLMNKRNEIDIKLMQNLLKKYRFGENIYEK